MTATLWAKTCNVLSGYDCFSISSMLPLLASTLSLATLHEGGAPEMEQAAARDCSVQHHRVRGRSTLHCNRYRLDFICGGGLPCESRGSQATPPIALQTGAVVTPNAVRKHRMPLRTQGSTECLYPVFSPTVFIAARVFVLHRQMAVQTAIPSMQHFQICPLRWLLGHACCHHKIVGRRQHRHCSFRGADAAPLLHVFAKARLHSLNEAR
jgi:hypothetical protein